MPNPIPFNYVLSYTHPVSFTCTLCNTSVNSGYQFFLLGNVICFECLKQIRGYFSSVIANIQRSIDDNG